MAKPNSDYAAPGAPFELPGTSRETGAARKYHGSGASVCPKSERKIQGRSQKVCVIFFGTVQPE